MLSERVIGKKAWVTGAAHGIGRASAWALAEAGADVAISDINEKGLEETAEYIRKLGRKALILPADITKESEIEETINTIVDKWGKLILLTVMPARFRIFRQKICLWKNLKGL